MTKEKVYFVIVGCDGMNNMGIALTEGQISRLSAIPWQSRNTPLHFLALLLPHIDPCWQFAKYVFL